MSGEIVKRLRRVPGSPSLMYILAEKGRLFGHRSDVFVVLQKTEPYLNSEDVGNFLRDSNDVT